MPITQDRLYKLLECAEQLLLIVTTTEDTLSEEALRAARGLQTWEEAFEHASLMIKSQPRRNANTVIAVERVKYDITARKNTYIKQLQERKRRMRGIQPRGPGAGLAEARMEATITAAGNDASPSPPHPTPTRTSKVTPALARRNAEVASEVFAEGSRLNIPDDVGVDDMFAGAPEAPALEMSPLEQALAGLPDSMPEAERLAMAKEILEAAQGEAFSSGGQ